MSGRIIHASLTAASLVLATGCATTPSPAAPPSCDGAYDEAAVVAVLETQRAAWNRGDLDGFLAGYERSSALLFTSGAKIRQGFDETRDKYRARYGEARETMGTLAFEILDVRPLGQCADAAIVLGRWALSDTPEAGSGVFSVILERRAGPWLIVHDHTSSDG
ncbi:L-asparaginase [Enhygromyxa salina]|uniref:L-asparaginase n=1 Tax=Enhygromyxa salina TaxID=215803 RepID=A0A0C1ZJT9_9BACT|nr:nuclear transport factor 2 family protein [Enhygromyxa salina]KIG17714.1 L-asparaginase [Enhygromyxa salina]